MPCPSCGTKLLLLNPPNWEKRCPRCDKILVVDYELALKISNDRISNLYDLFLSYLKQFKKIRLIGHIVWQREKFARDYFDNYLPFDMSRFVAYNFLIKRLMIENFDGYMDADEQNTADIIKSFSEYIGHYTEDIYLKEDFGELVADGSFDPQTLTIQDKLSKFRVIYTEDFLPLSRTFANNQIYSDEEGKKKGKEYRQEWEKIKEKVEREQKKVTWTPRQLIRHVYPFLNTLHCGLIKNALYAETFDLSNYEGIVEEPAQIMNVANGFMMVKDYATVAPLHEFRAGLRHVFKGKALASEQILLFSKNNAATFPLFVLLEDSVFISHRTAFIIYLLLHPILFKNYFNDETARISKELETKKAKEEFEKAGFRYVPIVTDRPKKPSLEIDGLAGKNGILHVVEVKEWGLTTFYEHKNKHLQLERDLKGIVDGIKYTTKDRKLQQKKIPSLPDKMEYARKNMEKHGFNPSEFTSVKGVIVIEDFPPIGDYKGIKIIGLDDVRSL